MKRNYCIDFVKFLFAVFIALGHYDVIVLSGGMIANCFFLVSGYFLVRSSDSTKYNGNSLQYTKSRIKRIYPYYLAALLSLLLYQAYIAIADGTGISSVYRTLKSILPELCMIQNIGVYDGGVNYPLWQLCTLIISSHILFSMLQVNKKLTINALCPLVSILGYTYLANIYGSHTVMDWGVVGGFIYVPLMRAFAGVSAGAALYELINGIVHKLEAREVNGHAMGIITILLLFYYFKNHANYQSILAFVGIFICCLYSKGPLPFLFNRKSFSKCEKLSLSIYVNHALIIYLFNRFVSTKMPIVFVVALCIYSSIFCFMIDLLQKTESKNKKYKVFCISFRA